MAPPLMWRWPDDEGPHRRLRVAVVEYPHVANATDLDALLARGFAVRPRRGESEAVDFLDR